MANQQSDESKTTESRSLLKTSCDLECLLTSNIRTLRELELRLQNWIKSFSAMRCLESTMLQEAYTVDPGGEA